MAQAAAETVVKCPACEWFVLRGVFEGTVEVNCKNTRCDKTLVVSVRPDGGVTVEATQKRKRAQ